MAEATVTTRVETVHIIMSADEARVLADMLQRVGGDPILSRRKHADTLRYSLDSIGYKGVHASDIKQPSSLYFIEDKDH